jgi:hypothetical protein
LKNAVASGSYGATLQGSFFLTTGQVLTILVGQQPTTTSNSLPDNTTSFVALGTSSGGTFVALGSNYSTAVPLLFIALQGNYFNAGMKQVNVAGANKGNGFVMISSGTN